MELIELLALQEGEKLTLNMIKSIDEIDRIEKNENKIWFTDNSAISWDGDTREGFVFIYDTIFGWANIYQTKRGKIESIEMQGI